MIRNISYLLMVLGISCFLIATALGQHPAHDIPIHETFYKDWMRPDHPTMSCCSNQDCAPVEQFREVDGQWQAKRERDGQWLTIDPKKVEWNRDSPDGRSHMCSMGQTVFCFVLGSGG